MKRRKEDFDISIVRQKELETVRTSGAVQKIDHSSMEYVRTSETTFDRYLRKNSRARPNSTKTKAFDRWAS